MEDKELYCYGCGAVLQTNNDQLPGYIPSHLMEESESLLCQRCFRLQHYGKNTPIHLENEEFLKLLKNINQKQCLVVYVIDIFNFFGSIIENLPVYLTSNPIMIVINKMDLLPKSVKEASIFTWVKKQLNLLKISYVGIELVSSLKNYNMDSLFDQIMEHRHNHDVYIVGNANVGKSSLINSILKNYSNDTSHFITSSVFPGTTIQTIQIPFDDSSYLYDTPGLLTTTSMLSAVDSKNLKYLQPKKEIKPVAFQLSSGQSLIFGSIVRLDFISGKSTSFLVYTGERVKIHRCKLELADEKFNVFIKDPLYIPKASGVDSIEQLSLRPFQLPKQPRVSLMIDGFGTIDIIHGGQTIALHVPSGVHISIQDPMIGGDNE